MRDHKDRETEQFVAAYMKRHQPVDEPMIWPSDVTPESLIRAAEARVAPVVGASVPRSRRPLARRLVFKAGFAAIVVGVGSDTFMPGFATAKPPATPAGIDVDTTSTLSAAAYLRGLAQRVAAMIEKPHSGYYTYTRSQTWSLDRDGELPGADTNVIAKDEQVWWAPNIPRLVQITDLPAQSPDAKTAQWTGALPDQGVALGSPQPVAVEGFSLVLDEAPASDPQRLIVQLEANDTAATPLSRIMTIADMCRYHALSPAQRAAILNVLADTPGVMYRDSVTDRAGRDGIAVSIDNDPRTVRQILVLDPDTGALLSREEMTITADPERELPANCVTAYVLYLQSRTMNAIS